MNEPTLHSHTHCQAAQANRNSQSLSISVSEPTLSDGRKKSTIAQSSGWPQAISLRSPPHTNQRTGLVSSLQPGPSLK